MMVSPARGCEGRQNGSRPPTQGVPAGVRVHERLLEHAVLLEPVRGAARQPGDRLGLAPGELGLGRLEAPGWGVAPSRRQNIVLEVASVQLPDGTLVQVGKSTESREALLQRFRDVASLVTLTVVLIARPR